MDIAEDMEIDPAIAAAMGFSGFGAQPAKKRKFDSNDAFVDSETDQQHIPQVKGANSMPLGIRGKKAPLDDTTTSAQGGGPAGLPVVAKPELMQSQGGDRPTKSQIQDGLGSNALRRGVRNERGDMVYFPPSFLEDPWKGLTPK